MTENAPPATAPAPTDSSRGMPYYDKLRKDLRDSLQKKRALDQSLAATEAEIYKVESSYLDETGAGNIIRGFDSYIKGGAGGSAGSGTATRRKAGVTDADRIFSRSSAAVARDSPAPSLTLTPSSSHAATPTASAAHTPGATSSAASAAPARKKKADADGEEDRAPKRGKISYARE